MTVFRVFHNMDLHAQEHVLKIVLLFGLFINYIHSQAIPAHKIFEYKHSFRVPNLAQRDGTIPFWIVTGDAIASSEQLRLAPSMRSRKGIAWNKKPFAPSEHFELEVALKITGQGRIGADGTLGNVYGANDYWTGMAVMLDSFDNDGMKNNPYVSVMINDGTRAYDHQTDGSQQILNGCQKDFRNKPFPVRLRIEYFKNILSVYMSDGLTQQPRYEICLRVENIFLPRNGYFGISAATGGLADDHDVLEFNTYSLYTERPAIPSREQQIPQDERQKYDQEFEKQKTEFEAERKKYKEQHPEKAKDDDEETFAKYYEDSTARELRLIYESQTAIHAVMQGIETKLQGITQQQQVHTQLLQHGAASVPAGGVQQQGGAQPGVIGFQPHEKSEVLQSLRDLTSSVRDMKNYVNEIFTRSYNIEQKINGAGGLPQQGGDTTEIRNKLDSITNEIRQIRSSPNSQAAGGCQDVPCVSSTLFMIIITVQSAVILVFVFLRSKNDKAKFY